MITHLEPDILGSEVKWVLGSITTNKASAGDGIPAELDTVKVLHWICQQIWKTQQWSQDWKKSVFISIPKKDNAKECSNCTIALISHVSKVMLKILQARLQQYMNHELPYVQAGCRKGKRTRDQITNICQITEKQENSRKTSSALLTTPKPCVGHHKLWKILQEMEIPDHLTCLLRNLYVHQEATVRTGLGTMDWFQIGKGVHQGCILSSLYIGMLQSMGSQRVRHYWVTEQQLYEYCSTVSLFVFYILFVWKVLLLLSHLSRVQLCASNYGLTP